jgi:hypothetical protein
VLKRSIIISAGKPKFLFFKDERQIPQGGRITSKEGVQTMGSLKLCRADMTMDGSPSSVVSKPMRGGTVEARTRDPWGQYLGEETPREDRPADHRLTPAAVNGSTGCSQPSEPGAYREQCRFGGVGKWSWKRHGG